MDSLAQFYVEDGEIPSAAKWNGLLPEIASRLPQLGPIPDVEATFDHPYKVSVVPDPGDDNIDNRLWQVRTVCGCINDVPVSIVYKTQGDPRGWTAPAGVDPANPPVVDRPLLETTPPPYLLLRTPPIAQTSSSDDFQPVPDTARPAFFRTAEMWEKMLYQASVVATSEPTVAANPSLPAIILSRLPRRYRLIAGRLPVTVIAQAGGQQEIARIYLLRDPDAPDAFADQILVRQFVFWDLASAFVQAVDVLDNFDGGIYGEVTDDEVSALLSGAATIQWWTM